MDGAILEPHREEASSGIVATTKREKRWRSGSGRGAGQRGSGVVVPDGAGAEPQEAESPEEQQAAGRLDDGGGAADSRDASRDRQPALSQPSALCYYCLTQCSVICYRRLIKSSHPTLYYLLLLADRSLQPPLDVPHKLCPSSGAASSEGHISRQHLSCCLTRLPNWPRYAAFF